LEAIHTEGISKTAKQQKAKPQCKGNAFDVTVAFDHQAASWPIRPYKS
jgi:hypothetical protein